MSLSVAGVWQVDVWDQTVWTDGVWREGAPTTPTAPDSEGLEYTLPSKKRGWMVSKQDRGWCIATSKAHYTLEEK